MFIRARCFKLTDDDWYGNYQLASSSNALKNRKKLVEVSLLTLQDGQTRVCVWGNDDTGRERDFDSVFDAHAIYMKLLQCEVINRGDLEALDFVPA